MDRLDEVSSFDQNYEKKSERISRSEYLTPLYTEWINASNFLIIITSGSGVYDGLLHGGENILVKIRDERTLMLPDWRGNIRIDSLRNTMADGAVSLLFVISEVNYVVRINGNASVTADKNIREKFNNGKSTPESVVVFSIKEIYFKAADYSLRSIIFDESI